MTRDGDVEPWPAPCARGPVRGSVRVPGSKSVTNRALVLAALSGAGAHRVVGAARSRDTSLMGGALDALGATVSFDAGATDALVDVTVDARNHFPHPRRAVDCGLAGTVMRFVPPVAALGGKPIRFDGDPHARTRPMRGVLDALRTLGVDVEGDALPFTVTGPARGGPVTVDAAASSQFVSGLLLSGARYLGGVEVRAAGPVPSLPHIDMTVAMVRAAGVRVDVAPGRWRVHPGRIAAPALHDVEPDLSGAAVYLAAAVLTGGSVTVAGWPAPRPDGDDLQPGPAVCALLEAFGATVDHGPAGVTVTGPDRLCGVDLDLSAISELTPTAAALAAVAARGGASSRLRGVAHIRGHETDRLAALATELTALGARVTETDDGLAVDPADLRAGDRPWGAYADHRMATAGALVGLVVGGITVDDITATTKTLPDFATAWPGLIGDSADSADSGPTG